MARYIGPKTKISRRFGEPIFGEDKILERRNFPPGQHGLKKKRTKKTEFGIQLDEKQKVKFIYGILEKQFRRMFDKASSSRDITGEVLLQLCERRLDNVVYRLGFSTTRSGARQLVSHKHIMVNGKISNIPSMLLKAGDEVSVREKSKNMISIESAISLKKTDYEWLSFNQDLLSGKFIIIPVRQLIPENINEQLIVELYSK